ncbi:MAG: response regulator transcription factor [Muribaculum sp.]|nr:response regulator transcription factor [Muribaculum sp.]
MSAGVINVAVCDDERYMADAIGKMATDFFRSKNREIAVCLFFSGEELLRCDRKIDILFLDIRMGSMDGLETASELRRRGFDGYLIFTTALREEVFRSFAVSPFDYLVKPIGAQAFASAMERLLADMSGRGASLLVQRGTESRIVTFEEIVYCEVMDRKIYLHLRSGETVDYYERIERLEAKLDRRFYRCHRSYLVNLQYLRSYQSGRAVLESDGSGRVEVPISRLKNKEFAQAVLQYLK